MRRVVLVVFLLLFLPSAALAQEPLVEARRLYNAGDYEAAERAALIALSQPRTANSARIVLGRVLLERYRQTNSDEVLARARDALKDVQVPPLDARERVELLLGFAQGLFLEDRFAAAAAMFEPIIGAAAVLGPAAHERALDWWASALDRHAATRPMPERPRIYDRIVTRMASELAADPGSPPANYWMIAAVRGTGDLDGAWAAAGAAWIRAAHARDRGTGLRGEIDRLVMEGVIPDRASRIGGRDIKLVTAGLVAEWDAFKAAWSR